MPTYTIFLFDAAIAIDQEFGFSPSAFQASLAPSFYPLSDPNGGFLNIQPGQQLFIPAIKENPTAEEGSLYIV